MIISVLHLKLLLNRGRIFLTVEKVKHIFKENVKAGNSHNFLKIIEDLKNINSVKNFQYN